MIADCRMMNDEYLAVRKRGSSFIIHRSSFIVHRSAFIVLQLLAPYPYGLVRTTTGDPLAIRTEGD